MNPLKFSQNQQHQTMIKARKKRGDAVARKRTREEVEQEDQSIADEEPTTIQSSSTVNKKQSANVSTTKKTTDDSLQKISSEKGFTSSREMSKDDRTTLDVSAAENGPTGPMKRQSNVRVSCRFDYQPGICKDYYETGFCGYGDDCIFAHIREEWKSGWKQDKEWDEAQKKKKMKLNESEEETNKTKDDGLPHACFICRNEFKNPVVTNCKHYFCESCALKHFNGGKNPKCFACGELTHGQFNTAHAIIKKQKRMAEMQKQQEKDFVTAE